MKHRSPIRTGTLAGFFLFVGLHLVVPRVAAEEPPTLTELVQSIQKHYESVEDLSARFEQESEVLGSRRKRNAQGTVKFKKPGMMRWDYTGPVVQSYIADGEKFYYYNVAEKFVAVRPLKQAFDTPTPNDFLEGLGKLEQSFNVSAPSDGIRDENGLFRVVLTPRIQGPSGYSLTLVVKENRRDLWGVEFTDAMGSKTVVRFLEVQENTGIADGVFEFIPPEGVAVRREF